MSRAQLCRRFLNATGTSIGKYVTAKRLIQARQMILQGSDSLVSISVASGFSDYRYFSQTFLKHYGMTPAEYRRHALETLPTQLSQNHSLHSREEIYGPQKALIILEQFQDQMDP